MHQVLKRAASSALALGAAARASLPPRPRACYWMTQDGSQWIAASEAVTRKQRFAFDSCSGGQGLFGGCGKWAKRPSAPGAAW